MKSSQSKAMELIKSVKCSFCDKLKVKYITQMKALSIIPMILESLILVFLLLGVPIVYAVNRDSLLKNPHEYPILRQFAENPVPVIIAMYIVPVAYFGGGILLDAFLYFYALKRDLKKLPVWIHITGTLLYIKVTIFLFVVFGFEMVDVTGLSLALLFNILFTSYSIWVATKFMKERNEEPVFPLSTRQQIGEAEIQSLHGTLV